MPNITIHISAFTKRILETRYGKQEPYQITRSDEIYHMLLAEPVKNRWCARKPNKLLTEKVQVNVNKALHRKLRAKHRSCFIGEHIHKMLQEKMLTFVEAQVLANLPAQRALKNFLQHHGVQEDDYSLESAYTAWKRYKQKFYPKNSANSAAFWGLSVPRKKTNVAPHEQPLPMPTEVILQVVCDFFSSPLDEVTGKVDAHPYKRKILAWVLYKYTHLTTRQITRLIPKHFSRISRYIQEINFQAEHYDEVLRDLQCIEAVIEEERTKMQSSE